MKKAGKVIVFLVVAALLVLAVMRFMKKAEVAEEETRPTVAVGAPEIRDIINMTTAIGTIEPQEEVAVMPKMAGEITAVNFAVGDTVEEGQVLLTIHSDALDSLRIQVDSAKIAMNDAQTALSRTQALFSTGAVSQQQLESAQSAAKSTKLAYENAQTQLNLQTGYTEVKAPIGGVVETKNAEVHAQASPAASICTISGANGMRISFGVTESVMKHLNLGDEVQVEKGIHTVTGSLTEVGSKVSSVSGLYDCKASLSGAEEAGLTSGSRAKLSLVSDQVKQVMAVPMSAVSYNDGVPFVYCLEDHHAVKKDLVTGLFDSEWIEVKEGLSAGDRLILTWSNEIYSGAEVQTVEEAEAAAGAAGQEGGSGEAASEEAQSK